MSSSSSAGLGSTVNNTDNLSPQLYRFVFLISAFMLFVWLIKTLIRMRSLYDLYVALKAGNVVRMDGLRQLGHLTREYLQSVLRSRSVHVSTPSEKILVHAHIGNTDCRVQVVTVNQSTGRIVTKSTAAKNNGNHNVGHAKMFALTCPISSIGPTRVDVYFGVNANVIALLNTHYDKLVIRMPRKKNKLGKTEEKEKNDRATSTANATAASTTVTGGDGKPITVRVNIKDERRAFARLLSASPAASEDESKEMYERTPTLELTESQIIFAPDEYSFRAQSIRIPGPLTKRELQIFVDRDFFHLLSMDHSVVPVVIHLIEAPITNNNTTNTATNNTTSAASAPAATSPDGETGTDGDRHEKVSNGGTAAGAHLHHRDRLSEKKSGPNNTVATPSARQMSRKKSSMTAYDEKKNGGALEMVNLGKQQRISNRRVLASEMTFMSFNPPPIPVAVPVGAPHSTPSGSVTAADPVTGSAIPLSTSSSTGDRREAAFDDSICARAKFDRQIVMTENRILELHELYGMEDESVDCIVCLTEPKDIILLPCRHVCICSSCHANVAKCPVCRSQIQSFMRFVPQDSTRDSLKKTIKSL